MSATPTTEAGQHANLPGWHEPHCPFRRRPDQPCTCGLRERVLAIEAQARSESAAQVALLREALERDHRLIKVGDQWLGHAEFHEDCEWCKLLFDTDAAAKEYEAAIAAEAVERWGATPEQTEELLRFLIKTTGDDPSDLDAVHGHALLQWAVWAVAQLRADYDECLEALDRAALRWERNKGHRCNACDGPYRDNRLDHKPDCWIALLANTQPNSLLRESTEPAE